VTTFGPSSLSRWIFVVVCIGDYIETVRYTIEGVQTLSFSVSQSVGLMLLKLAFGGVTGVSGSLSASAICIDDLNFLKVVRLTARLYIGVYTVADRLSIL
jgi:hypothetical protein